MAEPEGVEEAAGAGGGGFDAGAGFGTGGFGDVGGFGALCCSCMRLLHAATAHECVGLHV